jgi:hypothetical protein
VIRSLLWPGKTSGRVADVAGVEVAATAEVERLDEAFRAERLRLAVGEVVVAVAGSGAVIVTEDSHWLDDASRALVATLGRLLGPNGCLLLTRRPDGAAHPEATVLEIGPIAGASADALVLRELPDRLVSDDDRRRHHREDDRAETPPVPPTVAPYATALPRVRVGSRPGRPSHSSGMENQTSPRSVNLASARRLRSCRHPPTFSPAPSVRSWAPSMSSPRPT